MSAGRGRTIRRWYRHRLRGRLRWGVLALVGISLAVFGWQAWQASQSLRLAATQADLLQDQIVVGDSAGAARTLDELQESTGTARRRTGGPLWDVGARLPVLGGNLEAVQRVSEVLDEVAGTALPPVVSLAREVSLATFTPRGGRVDLGAVRRAGPSVADAERSLERAADRLDDLDPGSLIVPLRDPVATVKAKLTRAQSAAQNSGLAARLLPSMLGAKGARTYLLMVQNNAEVRSTGGIAGSIALIKARDGKITMGFQGSLQDLAQFAEPVLPMTPAERKIFPSSLVTNLLDTNVTPDFPRTAQIARSMVEKGMGVDVDGVISVDPVALGFVLAGTGPVQIDTADVVIDQVNAVELLLNTTYLTLPDPELQDQVFKQAARAIFDVVAEGRGDTPTVVAGLVRAASENRLLVWSARDDEQVLIQPSALSGRLAGDDGATPHVGVYLGDAASTKMEFYLDEATTLAARRCLPDGVQELSSSTELRSSAPSGKGALPEAVTGDGAFTPKGTMRLIVRLYSPFEGAFTAVTLDGEPQTVYADRHRGRNVTRVILTLEPGEAHTIETTMVTGRGQNGDAVLSTTPGVQPGRNDVRVRSACG